jgi:hypothetical protein
MGAHVDTMNLVTLFQKDPKQDVLLGRGKNCRQRRMVAIMNP